MCDNGMFCHHCRGSHRVGDPRCPKAIEGKQIIALQDQYKIERRRARQLYEGNTENNIRTSVFATHFKCTMDENLKRTLTPWHLEQQVEHIIGPERTSIRSMNRDSFIIEISREHGSNKVRTINKISNVAVSMPDYFQ